MIEYIRILDHGGQWLTPQERTEAHAAGTLYLESYSALALKASSKGICRYKIRPKLRAFQHKLIENLKHSSYNPRFAWVT